MDKNYLAEAAVLLATAALAAPLARALRIGSVLGYLFAGVAIGPYALGFFTDVESILHVAELGIVFLLFLIGLELRPIRLWTMRRAIFGVGGTQVLVTGLILATIMAAVFTTIPVALVVGAALAMSSTAFVLQVLEEKKELSQKHGRLAFSILLFQDLAAIPLIAVVPMLADGGAKTPFSDRALAVATALGTILAVVVGGKLLLDRVYRMVAASGVREAMTATALLTVIGVALVMQLAGLSAALGAFIAGAILSDSAYRHQIEADIQPFEGLLLGLFFTAIGMSLDLNLLVHQLPLILGLVVGLLALKGLILYGVGRWHGLTAAQARRLAVALAQGGEFAFVILGLVTGARLVAEATADLMAVVITLSMIATPLLLLLEGWLAPQSKLRPDAFVAPPEKEGHVVIAGLGRFGQIIARILRARGITFTALDISPDQIDLVRRFGADGYYGDASRLDILEAARTDRARAFVLAIDDVEASLKTAEIVRRHFPHVPIYARARNRQHVHKLMDLGVQEMRRETFLASIELTRDLLEGLGMRASEAQRLTETFAALDRKRLYDDYEHASDAKKLELTAKKFADELEEIFREDAAEASKIAAAAGDSQKGDGRTPKPKAPASSGTGAA